MDTHADIFGTLSEMFLCKFCALRFTGDNDVKKYGQFFDDENNGTDGDVIIHKHAKHIPCISCLGFFRRTICEETISKVSNFILNSGHDSDSFNVSLVTPISMIVRAYSLSCYVRKKWPEYCSKISSAEFWPPSSVKNLWKDLIAPKIADRVKRKFDIASELDITVSYVYADDEKDYRFLLDLFPEIYKNNEVSRTSLDKILRGTYEKWHFEKYFSSPPPLPNKFVEFHDVSMHHFSIYCGGRYNKWSRTLSQTPWIIQGKRRFETSVEELITYAIQRAFKATKTMFGSSGREDVDVRCLGRGRPFFVELINPGITKLTEQQLTALQKEININGQKLVRVKYLQLIDKSVLSLLKEGEESKKKAYCAYCVVWGPMPDLNQLSICAPFDINQKTPLRVLHRRPLLTRKRTIHELSAVPCKSVSPEGPSFFKINVTTQAGTYVKEFVHGDFGRTSPSLGTLLGGVKISILALDVMDICLDWPPNAT